MAKQRPAIIAPSTAWVPGWLIGPVLFLVAIVLIALPDDGWVPKGHAAAVDAANLRPLILDDVAHDPPTIEMDGFKRSCMECHKLFLTETDAPRKLVQHTHVAMRHGPIAKCSTCHDWRNRDRLVRLDGKELPFADSVALCGQCHAAVLRDWEDNVHGRSRGTWKTGDPARGNFRCTQCHDPHEPHRGAMSPIAPLPGPNTLRMGEPVHAEHHEHDTSNPLRRRVPDGGGAGRERK